MRFPKRYVGRWRIVHMDVWDQDVVDLEVPGHVTIERDGLGSFQFCAVKGWIDCRIEGHGPDERVHFTWDGTDDSRPVSGRAWCRVEGKTMTGHLYLHRGDDSAFRAEKKGGRRRVLAV